MTFPAPYAGNVTLSVCCACKGTFSVRFSHQHTAEQGLAVTIVEEKAGVEVGGISTGPERNETIIRAGSKFERLIG